MRDSIWDQRWRMWWKKHISWYWSRIPRKGHWQKHGRFKFLLAEEATFQQANQLKCGSKMRKRRPLSPLLIPPNSCLHLFVLFFYILAELIPHDADSVSHCISYIQFYFYCRFYMVRFLAVLLLITHVLLHLTLFSPYQPAFSLWFPTSISCLFVPTKGAKLVNFSLSTYSG